MKDKKKITESNIMLYKLSKFAKKTGFNIKSLNNAKKSILKFGIDWGKYSIHPIKGQYRTIEPIKGECPFGNDRIIKIKDGIVFLQPHGASRLYGVFHGFLKVPLKNFLDRYKFVK